MSLPPTTDEQIRIELWSSFLSVLRSYASLQAGQPEVVAIAECEAFMTAGACVLDIWCFAESGRGEWSIGHPQDDRRGQLSLNTDGTIILDGLSVDMDHAAIQLIASLISAASRSQIEVLA
jgi:hypothetical protein